MARLIFLTDFSEEYAKQLLKGIVQYTKESNPWVLCKMPLSYRDMYGIDGVLDWAIKWKADAIIGQFYPEDKVELFFRNGIIAIAQDFKSRFTSICNITGAHHLAGKMAADYFIQKGFKYFGFYGFKNIVWSEERRIGFLNELVVRGLGRNYFEYQNIDFKDLWYYESDRLIKWLSDLPKPVAIFAHDDNQGHHITELCRQYKLKVPEEVAVLGVDNDDAICSLSDPPLSSINQAVERGGYEVAKLIERLIEDPSSLCSDVVVMPTNIVTRESTDIYATSNKYILTALKFIHSNINRKISVEDIAALVPLSRRLLEMQFKEVTGMSIYNYVLHLRVDKIAQLLLESNSSVLEIVMGMGFFDSKNITRQFKKIKGCTPSDFRAINQRNRA